MKFRRSFLPIEVSFLVVFAGCEKEDSFSFQGQEKMQKAIEGMEMAHSEAESYNNSLKNAISMNAGEDSMQFYDSSYHHHDSLYQHHYKECKSLCSEDSGTGMMMDGGCSNKGMMMGNMMGGGMQMDCSIAGKSCHHAMDSLRNDHNQYCLNN
jgi:hypothetical protein